MKITRLSTAGSVDDGKSTFIGRLLYDTQSLPKDKIENIKAVSEKKGLTEMDLSLITDGLTAEREQGITIDVAHIYFSTPGRKYIIADTPGHVEYTRNMITGASNAEVFVILIDARKGIVEQTKRHLFIASLMEIDEILFVVNKMDLINYAERPYAQILSEIDLLSKKFGLENKQLTFFPVSAKYGDNVVKPSLNMQWYQGPTVLDYLESIAPKQEADQAFRMNVQYVIRPHTDELHDFRGYAGKITSGKIKVNDEVKVAATGQLTRVKKIHRYTTELTEAKAGDAVVVELEKDVDISRGDILILGTDPLKAEREWKSRLCWLTTEPLNLAGKYIVQQGAFQTQVKVTAVESELDFKALQFVSTTEPIKTNAIAEVKLKSAAPLFIEKYKDNPANGAFILIDPRTNATAAVGFKL